MVRFSLNITGRPMLKNDANFLMFESNPDAYWFDDYEESETFFPKDYSIKNLVLQLTKAIR